MLDFVRCADLQLLFFYQQSHCELSVAPVALSPVAAGVISAVGSLIFGCRKEECLV